MERLVRDCLDYNILSRELAIDVYLQMTRLPRDVNNLIAEYTTLSDRLFDAFRNVSCKYNSPMYFGAENYVSKNNVYW